MKRPSLVFACLSFPDARALLEDGRSAVLGFLAAQSHPIEVSHVHEVWAPLVAQVAKRLPARQETGFKSWVGTIPWRRKWHPIPVFLPGQSHGQRSLAGYCPWGRMSRIQFSD